MPNPHRKKHMIPKMFLGYLRNDNKLICFGCKFPKKKA